MPRTGRRIPGPGAQLVELEHDDLRHTAIVFESIHRGHPSLNADLEVGMGFMSDPQVTGLVPLAKHAPDEGAFIYATGTAWSVAEVVRELAETGDVGGVKAGLELCYMVGEVLVEAADQSVHSNLLGHGSLDPWRVLIKPDGQIQIVGYGLPRPEVELYLDDENRLPTEDSLRYCAPENLRAKGEHDLSSDLFALSLIALELMVGKPVYDGLVADVRNQAARAEAGRRLYQWRDKLPDTVREVLGKALKPESDIRYRDGLDYVYGVHDLLGGIDAGDGPSLRELVAKVRARQSRGSAVLGGNTGALSKAELAELAADIDNEGVATDLPTPRQSRPEPEVEDGDKPRWGRSKRKTRTATEAPAEAPRRRRSRSVNTEGDESARDRLLRRLRERSDTDEPSPRRRRSDRSGPMAKPEAQPEVEPASAVAASPAPKPAPAPVVDTIPETPTKRRRRGGRGAALLERLRSTSGGHTQTSDPTPDMEETVVAPIAPVMEVPVEEDEEDLITQVVPPAMAAAALRPVDLTEIASTAPTVRVRHAGQAVEVPWRGPGPTAEAAAEALGVASTDLLGTRRSGFWLQAEGTPLPPDAAVAEADLQVIENKPLPWTVTGPQGVTQVLVGAGVPVGALNRTLGQVFGLQGAVVLMRDGEPVPTSLPAALVPAGALEVRV